jgi:hypothetical protein
MSPLSPNSRKASRRKAKHSSRPRSSKQAKKADRGPSPRQQAEKVRVLAAINRVRRKEAKSPTEAARAEGTTLRAMRRLVPDALVQYRPGGRIRVKPTDRYSAEVQVLTREGTLNMTAHGSRQRELAGRHRATFLRVLQGKEPPSALEQFRGKKIGGHELISDYELLRSFAQAGIVGQLDTLYVSPDASV